MKKFIRIKNKIYAVDNIDKIIALESSEYMASRIRVEMGDKVSEVRCDNDDEMYDIYNSVSLSLGIKP